MKKTIFILTLIFLFSFTLVFAASAPAPQPEPQPTVLPVRLYVNSTFEAGNYTYVVNIDTAVSSIEVYEDEFYIGGYTFCESYFRTKFNTTRDCSGIEINANSIPEGESLDRGDQQTSPPPSNPGDTTLSPSASDNPGDTTISPSLFDEEEGQVEEELGDDGKKDVVYEGERTFRDEVVRIFRSWNKDIGNTSLFAVILFVLAFVIGFVFIIHIMKHPDPNHMGFKAKDVEIKVDTTQAKKK
ncbi:MAG: hypothetical protein AB7V77_01140 [Candidatus Woesearchaeota archaeon]